MRTVEWDKLGKYDVIFQFHSQNEIDSFLVESEKFDYYSDDHIIYVENHTNYVFICNYRIVPVTMYPEDIVKEVFSYLIQIKDMLEIRKPFKLKRNLED